jgi:CheY-like chemotaxis protein
MVRSLGWIAELAGSGTQALELVGAQCTTDTTAFPYPVIYMDWQLPDMDGWEATRRIRLLAKQCTLAQPTVIMMTAHGREMLAQRTEEEQNMLNGFLVKPTTASMLYDALVEANSGNSGMRVAANGRTKARQLSGMRILVVEDNLINQQVAEELLSAEGAIVSLAANGQIGVDSVAAAAPQFDVVLMDVQMPVLDGYGATKAIREDLGITQLPIIAMTANAMASDRDACISAGMNEHIGKPFDMSKLMSLLIRTTGFRSEVVQECLTHDEMVHALPDVAGLDLRTALGRMSGMRGLYVRTARDFVKIMDTLVQDLERCLAASDKRQAIMLMHTLKGNAGTLGATELAAKSAKLEVLCKSDGGMGEFAQGLEGLSILIQSTQQSLSAAIALLGKEPKSNSVPVSAALLRPAAIESLRKIAILAAASDIEALMCFAEARESLSVLPDEFTERLDEALQNLDLETAQVLCENMLSEFPA